jgi:hypothetical protein
MFLQRGLVSAGECLMRRNSSAAGLLVHPTSGARQAAQLLSSLLFVVWR